MKRWYILAALFLVIFAGSAAPALAPVDVLPGEAASALAAPQPITSGELDRTGYVKGFYVSAAALTSADFIARTEELLAETELNGIVMDFKSDYGYLTFPTQIALAQEIGADRRTVIEDPAAFLSWFKQRNVYTIARIVTFKDDLLANAYPSWAVYDANTGGVWHDHEGMGWLDGMRPETWSYNIQIAIEAARLGFDEVQFDYVRFPTDGNVTGARFSQENTYENRNAAITGLLSQAKTALAPYGVKLGADVFGYTAWVNDDLGIGQHIEAIAPFLDVLSPMVYPSTYNAGLPGEDPQYRNAVAYPYEIVQKSTERSVRRAREVNPNLAVRPWLQDFQDYAFDGRAYGVREVRAQIEGARDGGARGWLLWDPAVRYTREALVTAHPSFAPNLRGQTPVLVYTEPAEAATDPAVAERSAQALRADLEWLREQGFFPINLSDLAVNNLRSVPAGKRAVVLTFDGATPSQFRLRAGGAVDPLCTVGVLQEYSAAHPADWPLRGTFFVPAGAQQPAEAIFGSADLAAFKLQTLVAWGMEVGVQPVAAAPLHTLPAEGVQEALGGAQQQIAAWLPADAIRLLALPAGGAPPDRGLLAAGVWGETPYAYAGAVLPDGGLTVSPVSPQFDPYQITRIPAGLAAGSGWRTNVLRPGLYVSGGE